MVGSPRHSPDGGETYAVIVVGSGGPGLTAALAARTRGARVLLLESTAGIGGTTVFSGGQLWVPNHHHMLEAGVADSPEEALDYLRATSPDRTSPNDEERWAAFVENAPRMIRFLEEHTSLRFRPNGYPDNFAELEGGKLGGRNLEALPLALGRLGGRRGDLRYPCSINRTNLPLTWEEVRRIQRNTLREGIRLALPLVVRWLGGKLTASRALVAGLYAACLEHGVEVMLDAPARELLTSEGIVCGVRVDRAGKQVRLRARGGVILATGGFDWNAELKEKYLRGRLDHSAAVPSSRGDGHLMAQQVGAKLAHMDQAWYWAGFRNPRYYYEGAPLGSLITNLRSYPHSLVVNRSGRRFGNESSANFGNEMQRMDARTGKLVNLPCWAIFDSQFRRKFSALEAGIHPYLPRPSWVEKFGSLGSLGERFGIDPEGLRETVEEFNLHARDGRDPEFGRGQSAHDRYYGAPASAHPNLGTLEKAPFYAVELIGSAVGTKGGAMTSARGEVLDEKGAPIPGLYAVGNAADSIIERSISGGDTLGPGLTAGYVAGIAAAVRSSFSPEPEP
jgi:succinate dehydrogenase/fumarate reductase flavoprotein subunit